MDALDYIIVGQGIAGSCMARELISRGRKILIIDNSWKDAACLVAAGVINPITGQRLVKSWRSEAAHPYAKKFYRGLEKELGADFFHDRKILQLCKSAEERELWLSRRHDVGYAEFIGVENPPRSFENLNDSFGSFFIERSAWVEPQAAMDAFKKYFSKLGVIRFENFDYGRLDLSKDLLQYGGVSAKKIIFCEGWQTQNNPFFSWLPMRPAKGEILTLKSSADISNHIIHRGGWIMKCGENLFRVGSTWDRENLNSSPTAAAQNELLAIAKNMLPAESGFKIAAHSAGVRPCTATTRPHRGSHPEVPRLRSVNGFGSKGYALSPYFARHFADHLENASPIDPEADLKRHVKKFFKSRY